ncbi:hypothetical protein M408DRAFT_152610 [Serendipita vermifera MAFF 305830]|uniref:Uncharacterized protein n=1 Tax=Serendipita vermifera MAFF 305830 TaxID=933852 RepID=A0A0C2X5B1_SERVB|nr:hypothetical protein M408DRAFT_152610 [Serendipita vermifera MAFF 305830]
MRLRSFNTLVYSVGLLFISRGAQSTRNQTIDDTSKDIVYTGTWLSSRTLTDRINSTTHYTRVQGSYATYTFSGASALYFIGFGLSTANVDDGTVIDVVFDGVTNRVDQHRETRGQSLIWSSGPIDASRFHTIVCKKTSVNNGGFDLNIDAFILTIPDVISTATTSLGTLVSTSSTGAPSSISSSTTASSTTITNSGTASTLPVPSVGWVPTNDSSFTNTDISSASTSAASTASPTGPPTGAIAGGVIGAVSLLGLVALFFFLLGRRNRRGASSMSGYASDKRAGLGGIGNTNGTASTERITNDTELHDLTPTGLTTFVPLRTEKGWRGQGAAIGAPNSPIGSDMNSHSDLPTNTPDEEDTSSQTWITGPPAYDQLMSPTPLSRARI